MSLSFLISFAAYAGEESHKSSTDGDERTYAGGAKRGWWWYEMVPKKKENDKKTERRERSPRFSDYTIDQLWNMHPDDFQSLLMSFQKKAVQAPTEDNVKDYYTIQDIARRKSLAFANATAAVMQKYPELSLGGDAPITAPGRNAVVTQQKAEIEAKIRAAEEEFALLYFFAPDCPYCAEQQKILEFFREKYRWEIKSINTEEDARLSSFFGVKTPPTLLLVYRDSKEEIAISTGVASLSDIQERLYRGIRLLKKEITPEEYSLYEYQREGAFDVKVPLRRGKNQ